jgi:hypothetical protein
VAAVLLGGCSQSPDTTAVVSGVVIRESTVDEMAKALVSTGAVASYRDARASAARELIGGEVAREVARQEGITLTPADIATLASSYPAYAPFLSTAIGAEFARDNANAVQVSTTDSDWATKFAALPVELNPRYGSWTDYVADLASSTGSAAPTGSLSVVSGS